MATYKPDWKEARQRMQDWWAGKRTDRVPAYIGAPKKNAPTRKPKTDVPDRWTDPETVFYNLDIKLESRFWGGEAFPHHEVYLGPMYICAYYGCEPVFTSGTTWYRKPYESWDDAHRVRFDPSNKWWRLMVELTQKSVERAQGRYLTTISGACGVFDIFAELFGNEQTMLAMTDRPAEVKELRDRMIGWGKQTYDELYQLVSPYQEGSMDGMRIWSPGRVWYVQCDMCVMISPEMFDQFVLDELRAFLSYVDHGIYHLDGPEQIRHLDSLLSIEELQVIQYVPAPIAGEEIYRDPMNWIDLFRKIQDAGKRLWIICDPRRIKPLLDEISREGVFLYVECPDEKTAQDALSQLDRIGV